MRRVLTGLALAVAAATVHAETNVCTVISSLPYVIASPGSYCLEQSLTHTMVNGAEIAIQIDQASDVSLDCNGHRLTGTRLTPAQAMVNSNYTGIKVGSGVRVRVSQCKVSGFGRGISVESYDSGFPRSKDVVVEGNMIEGASIGIHFESEGNAWLRDNGIFNSLAFGIRSYAPPGKTFIANNLISRTGDAAVNTGVGIYTEEAGGWLVMEGNVVAETIAPPGGGQFAILVFPGPPGIGVAVVDNQVLAPANPAEQGAVTQAIYYANAGYCADNLFVGYGASLPTTCADPSNKAY